MTSTAGEILRSCEEYGLFDQLVRRDRDGGEPPTVIVVDDDCEAEVRAHVRSAAGRLATPEPEVLTVPDWSRHPGPVKRVVGISTSDEAALLAAIAETIHEVRPDQIFGLWGDLFVNKVSSLFASRNPDPDDFFRQVATHDTSDWSDVRPYAVVCTPRTGSTLLCNLLMQLGFAGRPREHLRHTPIVLASNTDFSMERFIGEVVRNGATKGVFGTKLISHFLLDALTLHADGRLTLPPGLLPRSRIVRLVREDQVAQAFSLHIAHESAVFFERTEQKSEQRQRFLESFEYAFEPILERLHMIEDEEERITNLLDRSSLPVLQVTYENLTADPTSTLRDVTDFLGLDLPRRFKAPEPTTSKLDDDLTAPLVERFRADVVAARTARPASERDTEIESPESHDTGPYQARDWRVVDYDYFRLPGIQGAWRGPKPDLDAGYFTALGAAQTLGRFCTDPYPSLLSRSLGSPVLNLGFSGAGPDFYLARPALLEHANRSDFAVVQVMPGRSVGNSMMSSVGGRNIVTWVPTGEEMFAEEAFRLLLEQCPRKQVKAIVAETRQNWAASMRELLGALTVPIVLLWFSERRPHFRVRYRHGLSGLFGASPQLVDAAMVTALRPLVDAYVEVVTSAGVPHALVDRFTGEPVNVQFPNGEWRGEDRSYPSPEMHAAAARALEAPVRALTGAVNPH